MLLKNDEKAFDVCSKMMLRTIIPDFFARQELRIVVKPTPKIAKLVFCVWRWPHAPGANCQAALACANANIIGIWFSMHGARCAPCAGNRRCILALASKFEQKVAP